jgi:hypothetical protein
MTRLDRGGDSLSLVAKQSQGEDRRWSLKEVLFLKKKNQKDFCSGGAGPPCRLGQTRV